MTVADIAVSQTPRKRVILDRPDAGWSAALYLQDLASYAAEFGRAPQTVTMHPDTATALGLPDDLAGAGDAPDSPFLVTSPDYGRRSITLYY
jgi:hypothetical protein